MVLLSGEMARAYPEGVKQPSQGQRPWYMVAVITAAPTGHNDQWLLLLCPAGACIIFELATRGVAPGWDVTPLRG